MFKKTLLISTLLWVFNSSYGFTYDCLKNLNIHKIKYQILFLKGGDCINCYKAGQMAFEKKIIKPEIIITKDVPKRTLADFLANEVGIDVTGLTVQQNDSIWNCINTFGTSAVAFIESGQVVKLIQTKNLLSDPELNKSISQNDISLIDSIDITQYYGGVRSTVIPIENDYLIYNDIKQKIIQISGKDAKRIFEFNPVTASFCNLDSIKGIFSDYPSYKVEMTKKRVDKNDSYLNGKFRLGAAPYVSANKIFVPLEVNLLDTVTIQDKTSESILNYPMMCVFDKNWNKTGIFGFTYSIFPNSENFYSEMNNGKMKDDCSFFMNMVSFKRDSLVGEYDLCKDKYPTLKKFLDVKYPEYFPTKGKQSGLISYPALFVSISGIDYYYFRFDSNLFDLTTNKPVPLSHIPNNDLTKDTIRASFICDIVADNHFLYVAYTSYFKTLYLNKYDISNFKLVSSSYIATNKFPKVFFQNNFICAVHSDDERVVIYRYKYK